MCFVGLHPEHSGFTRPPRQSCSPLQHGNITLSYGKNPLRHVQINLRQAEINLPYREINLRHVERNERLVIRNEQPVKPAGPPKPRPNQDRHHRAQQNRPVSSLFIRCSRVSMWDVP